MANPFEASFESECAECQRTIYEGEDTFAHEDSFYCEECADDMGIVCPECGRYKKPEFDTCFHCKDDGTTVDGWGT
jgi:hypothetical protein